MPRRFQCNLVFLQRPTPYYLDEKPHPDITTELEEEFRSLKSGNTVRRSVEMF